MESEQPPKRWLSTWRIIPASKWLISMVILGPLSRVVGPLTNGLNGLLMGVTNYLLTGMILQVRGHDKPIHGSCAIYFPGGILLNQSDSHDSLRCVLCQMYQYYRCH